MARRPNLLFIFTDEQRFDTMRCYGNDRICTPNLNALAGESFVFEHPYVSQPVCTPARSTIMTGLYPHTNGCVSNNIALRSDVPTLAEMASDDTLCAYYGKWHLGDEVIPQHGFERWVSIEDTYRQYYSEAAHFDRLSDYHRFLVEKGFAPEGENSGAVVFSRRTAAKLPEEFTKARFLGREAARFLKENGDRPFALYVNFLEPHMPFTGPLDDMYPPEALPVGPHFMQRPPEDASLKHRQHAERFMGVEYDGHDLGTEAGWRKLRAKYWGLVTLVDRAVGEILQALEACGAAEDTIVVFTSDHGDMMGDHGMLTKGVLYEEAVKVPLLMRVPWLGRKQRTIQGRIGQVDLVPTLLELMGAPVPEGLQGESRVPVLRGEDTLAGNDAFIEWNVRRGTGSEGEVRRAMGQMWRTVVSAEGWKLNLSAGDQCELYDLNTDPCEQTNRFDDPDQKGRVRDLTGRIERWQERTGDDISL